VINAIKFSIEEIEASDQYFDHTGLIAAGISVAIIAVVIGLGTQLTDVFSTVSSDLAAQ
jgi:hypothetical protein